MFSFVKEQHRKWEERVQIGKDLYHTSIGEFDPPAAGQPAITGRMSNNGWGSCASARVI